MCTIILTVTNNKTNNKFKFVHTFKDLKTAKIYRDNFYKSIGNSDKIEAIYKL